MLLVQRVIGFFEDKFYLSMDHSFENRLNNFKNMRTEVIILCIFFIFGLALRLIIFNVFVKYPYIETYYYTELAKNISLGKGSWFPIDGADVGLMKQPLYPFLISLVHLFIKDWLSAAVFTDLFVHALLIYPLFFIAKAISNKSAGYITCLIYTCSPFFLVPGQTHGIFVFFLCLPLLHSSLKQKKIAGPLILGFLLCLLWLARFESIFFIIFFLLWYIFNLKQIRTRIISFLLAVFTFCITIYISGLFLNPGVSTLSRLRYRIIMAYFPLTEHFLPGGWCSDKTAEWDSFVHLANSKPNEALLSVVKKCLPELPLIVKKNILNSFQRMFESSLSIWLLLFAFFALFFIKLKALFISSALLPFIYAPFCSPDENANYTRFTVVIIMILASAGIFYLSGFLSKFLFQNKEHKLLKQLLSLMIALIISADLFSTKFPLALDYTYTESDYEYKRIFSENRFKAWIQKNIPPGAGILAPNDINAHLLFNDYRLCFAIKGNLDDIVGYAKNRKIEYCLLDEYILDCKNYQHLFDLREETKSNTFSLIDRYESQGKIFYLLRIF